MVARILLDCCKDAKMFCVITLEFWEVAMALLVIGGPYDTLGSRESNVWPTALG